jgi:predicted nucleotide-binding protein
MRRSCCCHPMTRQPPRENMNLAGGGRQNVILELGYFIGRLGRPLVAPLIKDGVGQPSDYHGIVYIPYRDQWPTELARELSAMGLTVDLMGLVR